MKFLNFCFYEKTKRTLTIVIVEFGTTPRILMSCHQNAVDNKKSGFYFKVNVGTMLNS